MNSSEGLLKRCRQESFDQEVLETYKSSSESVRMDMYMTYRDMRESFEMIEVSASDRSPGTDLIAGTTMFTSF